MLGGGEVVEKLNILSGLEMVEQVVWASGTCEFEVLSH